MFTIRFTLKLKIWKVIKESSHNQGNWHFIYQLQVLHTTFFQWLLSHIDQVLYILVRDWWILWQWFSQNVKNNVCLDRVRTSHNQCKYSVITQMQYISTMLSSVWDFIIPLYLTHTTGSPKFLYQLVLLLFPVWGSNAYALYLAEHFSTALYVVTSSAYQHTFEWKSQVTIQLVHLPVYKLRFQPCVIF